MALNKFVGIQNERKFDYVFLLIARYDGKIARMAKTMGIPQDEIKNWETQFGDEVRQWIDNRNKQLSPQHGSESEEVPEIESLKLNILIQLQKAINKESDPSRLARTYESLSVVQKDNNTNKKDDGSDIDDAVKQAIENN